MIAGDAPIEVGSGREAALPRRDRVAGQHATEVATAPAGEYSVRLRRWDCLGRQGAAGSRVFSSTSPEQSSS